METLNGSEPFPIQLTILTGSLGSGKTTLLNRLLSDPQLSDTAVIVNEFGEIGIDNLVLDVPEDGLIELSSGCLCCSIRGDLVNSLVNFASDVKSGQISSIRRIIIETTGLADPIPILQTVMSHPFLNKHFQLYGIVTCVDLLMGTRNLIEQNETVRQIAVADRIVLTKSDLIDINSPQVQDASALLEKIQKLNSSAKMLDFAEGEASKESLFHLKSLNINSKSEDVIQWLNAESVENSNGFRNSSDSAFCENSAESVQHMNSISSYSLVSEKLMTLDALNKFTDLLGSAHGDRLLRTKGIIGIRDHSDEPVMINGVRHVFHQPIKLNNWPKGKKKTRIVFITEGVPESELKKMFFAFVGIADIDTPDMKALTENPLSISGFSHAQIG